MKQVHVVVSLMLFAFCSLLTQAQQMVATNTNVVVPPLVNFSGALTEANGKPLIGVAAVTFSLYSEQSGGAALWMETQNVTTDSQGHYTVMLGSTSSTGLPAEIFVAGEAHWLGVHVQGQEEEQPRVLLVSAPYALKAGDAQTIGGLPPSAFVLAVPPASGAATAAPEAALANTNSSVSPATSSDVTTTGGTPDALPLFTTTTNIQNSLLTQTGTTAINVGGKLNLPALGTATSSAGFNSRPQDFVASAYNSSTAAAVAQTFQWQAQAAGNDTATPSATLNLLFGSGTGTPAQTGLKIASAGLITFAKGQTFPGVPLLSAANTFTGNQAITGNLTDTGNITATGSITGETATFSANTSSPAVGITQLGSGTGLMVTAANAYYGFIATGDAVGVDGNAVATGGYGMVGSSTGGRGVYGIDEATSGASVGVYGQSNSSSGNGVVGQGANGVQGISASSSGTGGVFTGYSAPSGSGNNGTAGVRATGGNSDEIEFGFGGDGVVGQGGIGWGYGADGSGGVFTGGDDWTNGDGVDSNAGSGYAGNFSGDLNVTGAIYAGTKDFKLDHPLDPANKYLYHASVESSEMKNIYDGVVTTDGQGEATVQLPDWFEVLNTDFRYQLTVIGQFAQAIVAGEIQNHQFQIKTNAPNVKVSWQVTGVRQDAYAKAHPLVVEEEKEARLKGYYIHPDLYGAPEEKQIEWARHPQMMKKIQQIRQAQLQHRAARSGSAPPAAPEAGAIAATVNPQSK